MAAKTTLNAKNLQALGSERLAELIMELVTGDAALKRQARAALLDNAGGDALVAEVRKRIATIKRSTSFVDWHKHRAFAADLERQRATIVDKIAPDDPKTALELMWRFLELAGPTYERADDSNGTFGDIFREACADLGPLMAAAKPDPVALADQVYAAAIEDNDYAQYDNLIGYAADALGEKGLTHLKSKAIAAQKVLAKTKPEPKSGRVVGWSPSGGHLYSGDYEHESSQRRLRYALQEIADAEGDVDAYIAGYDAKTRTVPAVAAGIASRLLAAGRADEAMTVLESADADKGYIPHEFTETKLAALEALGRGEEAQAFRWERFESGLSAEHLRAYLKGLPDFEDVEAEERALDHAQSFSSIHSALSFLIEWPSHEHAAKLVLDHADDWDGDAWYFLPDAAEALAGKYPLAATVLLRALITYTLGAGKAKRYKHAARHLLECESLAATIEDYGALPSHNAFVAMLKQKHPRKSGFWSLVPSEAK